MILKQLRLSQNLSQEQLAQMSGLSVRTIQRLESGQNVSLESKKCLAAALDVDIATLEQESMMIDTHSNNWQQLPLFIRLWFMFNFLQTKPMRYSAKRILITSHITGFLFCCLGFFSEPALAGGVIMLATAYLFQLLLWQGDKYAIWFDEPCDNTE